MKTPLSPTWKRKESNHKYGGMEGSGKENGLGGYWGGEEVNLIRYWVREKNRSPGS